MNNEKTIRYVADLINEKKKNNKAPILFLGVDSSSSSSCPSSIDIINKVDEICGLGVDPCSSTLYDIKSSLSSAIFDPSIQEWYKKSFPSKGYWFLGEILRNNFISLICSLCYDSCLENVLSKLFSYEFYKIHVRGDVEDSRIADSINNSWHNVNIIKVSGHYMTKNDKFTSNSLFNLGEDLKRYINNQITNRGSIVIGFSKHDSNILDNFSFNAGNKDSKNIFICNSNDHSYFKNYIGSNHNVDYLCYDDFDEFFRNLSWCLYRKNESKIKKINQIKADVFDNNGKKLWNLFSACNLEVDRKQIEIYIKAFIHFVDTKCPEASIAFIHDPDCPGGTEILKILEHKHAGWISEKRILKVIIEGRGVKIRERKVTGFKNRNDKDYNFCDGIGDNKFLLVDSISFSGGTLRKCCRELSSRFLECNNDNCEISAAILFSGPNLNRQFNLNKGLFKHFLSVKTIKSHQILFPWGYASSTEPIFPTYEILQDAASHPEDVFIPHNLFGYWPRPWGSIYTLSENQFVSVKMLSLNAGEKLSKHLHHVRDEVFLVLDEHITLQVWDTSFVLRKGDSFRIPAGTLHRLVALDSPCRILEIAYKYYDQVDDIKREDDKYDRVKERGDV